MTFLSGKGLCPKVGQSDGIMMLAGYSGLRYPGCVESLSSLTIGDHKRFKLEDNMGVEVKLENEFGQEEDLSFDQFTCIRRKGTQCVKSEGDAPTGPTFFLDSHFPDNDKENVPPFQSYSGSSLSGGRGLMISPAPSSVFIDEDSHDSGYSGSGSRDGFNVPGHLFRVPSHPVPSRARCKYSAPDMTTTHEEFDEDRGFFEHLMDDDSHHAVTPPSRGGLKGVEDLVRKPILLSPNDLSDENDTPTSRSSGFNWSSPPNLGHSSGPFMGLKRRPFMMTDTPEGGLGPETSDDTPSSCFLSQPSSSQARQPHASCGSGSPIGRGLKRPKCSPENPVLKRRRNRQCFGDITNIVQPTTKLHRCLSETDASFTSSVDLKVWERDSDLIGDHSRAHALPSHKLPNINDMRGVSPETVRSLLSGSFDDVVESCSLIDCRYPYEFVGGHIQGAKNLYLEDDIVQALLHESVLPKPQGAFSKARILIFYCEYSSQRGPSMCRLLRRRDRAINGAMNYPKLYYPEIYLLEGGYRAFFSAFHGEFCLPRSYLPMNSKDHSNDLKHFKSKSKSWAGCSASTQPHPMTSSRRLDVSGVSSRIRTLSRTNSHQASAARRPIL